MAELIKSPITGKEAIAVKTRKDIPEGAEKDLCDSNEYFETWQLGQERFYWKYPRHLIKSRWKSQ